VARGAGRSRSSLGRGYASQGKPSTLGVVLYGRCRALWALRGKPSVLLDLWLGVVASAICWVELFDLSGVSHLRILGSSDVSRHVTPEPRCVSNEVRPACRPPGPTAVRLGSPTSTGGESNGSGPEASSPGWGIDLRSHVWRQDPRGSSGSQSLVR
jgi:hypothetical protein